MKILTITLCCVVSFVATAKDIYVPPTLLTPAEMRQAEMAMEKTRNAVNEHWRARSLMAQARRSNKAAASQSPMKSLDDSVHKHE